MERIRAFKEVVQRIEKILGIRANFRDLSDENQASAVIYHNNYVSLHTVKLIESEVNNECVFSIRAQGNRIVLKFGIASS
jgi:hypothetical protein